MIKIRPMTKAQRDLSPSLMLFLRSLWAQNYGTYQAGLLGVLPSMRLF